MQVSASYAKLIPASTSSFRSQGRTFDFHNPTLNAAAAESHSRAPAPYAPKRQPATWETLLSSSRTIHEQRPGFPSSEARKLEVKKAARTIYPELQDPPKQSKAPSDRKRLNVSDLSKEIKLVHGITGCERKHNQLNYTETVQVPRPHYKPKGLLNMSLDSGEAYYRYHQPRLNVDRIGNMAGTQIRDSCRGSAPRP